MHLGQHLFSDCACLSSLTNALQREFMNHMPMPCSRCATSLSSAGQHPLPSGAGGSRPIPCTWSRVCMSRVPHQLGLVHKVFTIFHLNPTNILSTSWSDSKSIMLNTPHCKHMSRAELRTHLYTHTTRFNNALRTSGPQPAAPQACWQLINDHGRPKSLIVDALSCLLIINSHCILGQHLPISQLSWPWKVPTRIAFTSCRSITPTGMLPHIKASINRGVILVLPCHRLSDECTIWVSLRLFVLDTIQLCNNWRGPCSLHECAGTSPGMSGKTLSWWAALRCLLSAHWDYLCWAQACCNGIEWGL